MGDSNADEGSNLLEKSRQTLGIGGLEGALCRDTAL